MRSFLGRVRRRILGVARALRLTGPVDRLHRVEDRLIALEGTLAAIASRFDAAEDAARVRDERLAVICGACAALSGRVDAMEAEAAAISNRNGVLASAVQTLPERMTRSFTEELAREIDRLDGYLVLHADELRAELLARSAASAEQVAELLARSAASAEQVAELLPLCRDAAAAAGLPDKIEAELDRLDGVILYHASRQRDALDRLAASLGGSPGSVPPA